MRVETFRPASASEPDVGPQVVHVGLDENTTLVLRPAVKNSPAAVEGEAAR